MSPIGNEPCVHETAVRSVLMHSKSASMRIGCGENPLLPKQCAEPASSIDKRAERAQVQRANIMYRKQMTSCTASEVANQSISRPINQRIWTLDSGRKGQMLVLRTFERRFEVEASHDSETHFEECDANNSNDHHKLVSCWLDILL